MPKPELRKYMWDCLNCSSSMGKPEAPSSSPPISSADSTLWQSVRMCPTLLSRSLHLMRTRLRRSTNSPPTAVGRATRKRCASCWAGPGRRASQATSSRSFSAPFQQLRCRKTICEMHWKLLQVGNQTIMKNNLLQHLASNGKTPYVLLLLRHGYKTLQPPSCKTWAGSTRRLSPKRILTPPCTAPGRTTMSPPWEFSLRWWMRPRKWGKFQPSVWIQLSNPNSGPARSGPWWRRSRTGGCRGRWWPSWTSWPADRMSWPVLLTWLPWRLAWSCHEGWFDPVTEKSGV